MKGGSIIHIGFALVLSGCIETFDPKISEAGIARTLVVDGRITDQEGPYTVRLSRSALIGEDTLYAELDATVMIEEQNGSSIMLNEERPGVYVSNSADMRGEVGKRYRIAIELSDGSEYQSSWQLLRATPAISDIRYEPDINESQRDTKIGAQLYLDTEGNEEATFFKWEMYETWKYSVPFASDSVYVGLGMGAPKPVEDIHETCWKYNRVGDIKIRSVSDIAEPSILNHPLHFISSDSARLNLRYSVLIEQFAISAEEFTFWQNMENINENVGELFDKQPFEVTGNIQNVENERESVLGYFSAYSVQSVRVYLNREDFPEGHLPRAAFYTSLTPYVPDPVDYDCKLYYHPPQCVSGQTYMECLISWDINIALLQDGNLRLWYQEDYWFTTPVCGDCELYGGTTTQPDFWQEG